MYRIYIIPNTVFFPVLFIVVVAFILARMIIHFFTHKIVVIEKYMNFNKIIARLTLHYITRIVAIKNI